VIIVSRECFGTFQLTKSYKGITMHQREKVLELSHLLLSKGQELPKPLIKEAKRLGIQLPSKPRKIKEK
tara:strand:- start:310 stop:516 length:207 start_codon:yes stop_codon:yes gene_type:complete